MLTLGASFGTAWAGSDQVVKANPDAIKTKRVEAPQGLVRPMAQIIVTLRDGINPDLFASYYGLRVDKALANENQYSMNAASVAAARQTLTAMQGDSAVVSSYQNALVKRQRFAFTPNDPYYTYNNPVGFPGQWHLVNTNNVSGANIDSRVLTPWNNNFTGTGVLIGICDDGMQTTHPDLSANYSSANSFDFGQNDGVPDPVAANDVHGTAVTGVAAARGGNSVGVTGAAPLANWAGLRMDFDALTWQQLYDVIDYRSNGTNSNIKIKNHSYGATDTYGASPTEKTRLATSVGVGTIHTWAAGNSRGSYVQDANKQEPQNSPDAITVAALSSTGKFASYSSFGANVFVTAPSSSSGGFAITTTDRTGSGAGYNGSETFTDRDYTSTFGGTSSASPLTAGVLALVKQAQPNLNTRFAKHLIVKSSDIVDASDATPESDGGWKTNGAGNKFNQNYGFGLLNATKLVTNSTLYTGVTALETNSTALTTVGAAIPDRTAGGDGIITRTFTISSTKKLEEVLVYLKITHPAIGDVEAYLTSPSGTKSRLMFRSGSEYHADLDWTFCTNAFWGENPSGTWTIEVRDVLAADSGTWNQYQVTTRHGELVAASGSGDQAQFVSQTVPTTMYAGITYSATVNIKNTGSTTWTSAGYRMVSQNPYNNNTWGRTSVTLGAGDSIAPGQTKSFVFNITAPATNGTYNFQWQMRRTSGTPTNFGDLTTNVPISVISGNFAQFIEQSIPATMVRGTKYNCFITMRNMGTTTWTLATGYNLTTINPLANNTWGFTRRDLLNTDSILPGQYKTWYFKVLAPATPGTYNFQMQMRKAGVANFGDATPNVAVVVS